MDAITFTKPDGVAVASVAPAAASPGAPGDAARRQAGDLLVQLFGYLDAHAVDHPALLPAITGLRDAVAEHRSAAAGDPLDAVRGVVAMIGAARTIDPALPEP